MDHIIVEEYMRRVQDIYATGVTTEHSFRSALGYLFDNIHSNVKSINEPKGIKVGRPDFAFVREIGQNQITIGHCEAKDIDKDINPKGMRDGNKDQFKRYIKGLPNLIYTNGLEFHFYKNGELIKEVRIADFAVGITPIKRRYPVLVEALKSFVAKPLQTITSAKRLAELMAGKALLIKEVMFESIMQDEENKNLSSEMIGQFKAFKEQLIHDLTPEGFADIYAETVVYGMFAARLKDETKEDFSRMEALELLPKSNPFLRDLFSYVAGPNLDERIRRDIDELAEIFVHVDPDVLFKDFGHFTKRNDPFIHFYETFLAEYNPKKRKARGVWYTPEPVVNFIVRAVDDVLKSEFGLRDGLACTDKITIKRSRGQKGMTKSGKRVKKEDTFTEEVHRVQILDPATGTGTFLAETIKLIGSRVKRNQSGNWSSYVENELIPRLHGFELLMASYAMCHMKLDMMLHEMDYVPTKKPPRLSVYLTNSLEEGEKATYELPFANFLSKEANAANEVKNNKPIMCIIGNPPYSGHSSNKGAWIESLMGAYKVSPELKRPAQAKWLSDDYVKFIRMSEHMITENGEGILAFITNHGYLDNPTFVDMRASLKTTFDKIYVVDLHGNAKKKEVSPDGSPDKNVFDIQQGVSILIGVKLKKKENIDYASVFHGELWGTRQSKYENLANNEISDLAYHELRNGLKDDFRYLDYESLDDYTRGLKLNDLFSLNGKAAPGMATQHDQFAVSFTSQEAISKVEKFLDTENEEAARQIFRLCSQNQWVYSRAKTELVSLNLKTTEYAYRPFDIRQTILNRNIAIHQRVRVSKHMLHDNLALLSSKNPGATGSPHFDAVFLAKSVSDLNLFRRGGAYVFPLYLYPETSSGSQTDSEASAERVVNMDPKIRAQIEVAATDKKRGAPDEVAIFDYIYGVLHCTAYRETYAEFLKIDFPRVPYPSSPDSFWDIAAKGTKLRKLHLMEADAIGETKYPFYGEGDPVIEKPVYEATTQTHGRVLISKTHYFDNVPLIAWEFYIGGYQPAQKWLKDRKGAKYNDGKGLDYNDVRHYQGIIKVLSETDRIMKTITMDL